MRMTVFNADGPFVHVRGIANLRAASAPGRVRVFSLHAPGSPYARDADFTLVKTSVGQDMALADPTGPTDSAQYVGVYRDSDWGPPLESAPAAAARP